MLDPDRRHLIAYVAAAAVLVVMAMRLVGGDRGSGAPAVSVAAPAQAPAVARREVAAPARSPLVWVDVAGAVRRPGLYSLPKGARVAAAIQRAGGVRGRADRAAVNLAAKVMDGQQVFVPVRAGGSAAHAAIGQDGSAGAAAGGSVAGAAGGTATAGVSAPVSLSNATQAQLETLDGIGPALALRIIEYRDQNGGFRSIDQLREVSGIGDKRFEALKDSIVP